MNKAPIAPRRLFVCLSAVLALVVPTFHSAAQGTGPHTIRIVRVGTGNVEGLVNSITISNDACRVARHLPPAPVALPAVSVLSTFPIEEQEELFDGQHWALYETQRQIFADGIANCRLVVFSVRTATVELTCVSKIAGGVALLGEMTDFTAPAGPNPQVTESVLPARACKSAPRPVSADGAPRQSAGSAQCIWLGDLLERQMASLATAMGRTPPPAGPAHGLDQCLLAQEPYYFYQGERRAVVLKTEVRGEDPGGSVLERSIGETAAFSHLELKSLDLDKLIPPARFERASVSAFIEQPVKSALP